MKRPPVQLNWPQRVIVCLALAEKLEELNVEVVEVAMTKMHMHVLARFVPLGMDCRTYLQSPGMAIPRLCETNMLQDGRDPRPRHCMGVAKKHASHLLRERNLHEAGGSIWAVRSKIHPVECREHQVFLAKYIRDHARKAAPFCRCCDQENS